MKFENGYNKLGWKINDEKPPALPSCFEKNNLGTVSGTLAEFFRKNTNLGLSV